MKLNVGKISAWYLNHKEHVDKLVLSAERRYPPSERGDINHPELWKAEHWKWFLNSPVIKIDNL